MSLILEALRRSEAERRRGAPPGLLDPGVPPRARRASPWPMALAGLLGGLLIAGAAAWWWPRDRAAGNPTALATPSSTTAPTPPTIPSSTTAPPSASTPESAPNHESDAPPVAPAPTPAATAPPAPAPAPPSPAVPEAASAATPAAPPAFPPAPTTEPTAASASEPLPASEDAATGPRPGDVPLGELIGAARETLPPLRVSMHVYADDPARRFAIVDGQRRREGEPLGGGVQLVEIRRDGLRLAWQDRTLWVPR